jgi:hypothetical protein
MLDGPEGVTHFSEDLPVLSLALLIAVAVQPADVSCAARLSPCHVDTRLSMAGIENEEAARDFIDRLRTAARQGDQQMLIDMIQYPIKVHHESGSREYRTREELMANFSHVFTPTVLGVIGEAQYETLFINSEGAMIGNGEVWFDGSTGPILIKAINP